MQRACQFRRIHFKCISVRCPTQPCHSTAAPPCGGLVGPGSINSDGICRLIRCGIETLASLELDRRLADGAVRAPHRGPGRTPGAGVDTPPAPAAECR
jgi:hypothetical protein